MLTSSDMDSRQDASRPILCSVQRLVSATLARLTGAVLPPQAVIAALPAAGLAQVAVQDDAKPRKKRKKADQAATGDVAPVAVPDPGDVAELAGRSSSAPSFPPAGWNMYCGGMDWLHDVFAMNSSWNGRMAGRLRAQEHASGVVGEFCRQPK